MKVERVSVTAKAAALIKQVREQHGDLIFHQSGGCCDGSAPMCLQKSEFLLGGRDLLVGEIEDTPFYMSHDQFSYFRYMHITLDVSEGRGSSFSLEIPLGFRFKTVSRLFTEDELQHIKEIPDS